MSYPTHANQNTYYVIYPRSTQAYNYARTSTWVNQRGYITLARTSISCANQNTYYVIYPRSTQAYNYARTSTWVNQRGYITLARTSISCANQSTYYVIYSRSTQAYNYARTSTWVNQRGFITLARTSIPCANQKYQSTAHVIYPRSTQAYNYARTSTWVNQRGYITLARTSIPCANQKYCSCYISQKHSGIQLCQDFNLGDILLLELRYHVRTKSTAHVIYPRSTQAYNYVRTSTWVNQRGYITLARTSIPCANQKYCSCYISQKHSGIQLCQDFNLGEPKRIYNTC